MNFGTGPPYQRGPAHNNSGMEQPARGNRYSNIPIRRHETVTQTRKITSRTYRNYRDSPYQRQPQRFPAERSRIECPICLSDIFPSCRMKAIQCCGYVFCGTCITKCVKKFKACPMCNRKLTPNALLSLRFGIE